MAGRKLKGGEKMSERTKMPMTDYQVIRSGRETVCVQITRLGKVLVRAPLDMTDREIDEFVRSKSDWLSRKLLRFGSIPAGEAITPKELEELTEKAKAVIPQRVAYYAPQVGVSFGRITVRHQKTRWGSCTRHGNLNFNCLLMLAPPEVLDAVVVHELCHRLEMNHSAAFYRHVRRVLPDYDRSYGWLEENGRSLIARMVEGEE